MNRTKVQFITRTAILLALTVVFQLLGRYIPLGPNSNFVVGPLVNACLLIATATAGIASGLTIAVIAPFTALLTGGAIPPLFLPFVSLGNTVLVIVFHLLRKKAWVGIITGAVAKFAVLYAAITGFLAIVQVKPKLAGVLVFTFSWPQFVTACAGGILAMLVVYSIGKNKAVEL